jgi:hypothetical protein
MAQDQSTEEQVPTSTRGSLPLPPDDLLYNVPSDIGLVTEELQEMKPLMYRLIIAWFLVSGFLGLYSLIICYPVLTSTACICISPDSSAPATNASVVVPASTLSTTDTARNIILVVTNPNCTACSYKVSSKDIWLRQMLGIPSKPDPIQTSLIIVCLTGWLGGILHGLSSIIDYRGARRLFASWTLWYFVRPFQGALVAVIFLAVIQGGLLPGSGVPTVNTVGVIAIGFIVGLSADAATTRLSQVFKALFAVKDGTDALRGGNLKPEITLLHMTEHLANIKAQRIKKEEETAQATDPQEKQEKQAEVDALIQKEKQAENTIDKIEQTQAKNDDQKTDDNVEKEEK